MEQEIKNGTYTIPEGFTAKIEDGKIIVEKKAGSDGEKIRKILVQLVQDAWDGRETSKVSNQNEYEACISWLEKQKEQKEQKSEFKWEDDEKMFQLIENVIRVYGKTQGEWISGVDMDTLVVFLRRLRDNNKPAEWSEEDEKFFKTALWHISYSVSNGKTTDDHCGTTDWLKGVKERLKSLRPQPHWKPSEQEKGALRTAIHVFTEERNFPKAAAHLQNILDAFEGKESREDWKPSEEQMKIFNEAIEHYSKYWDSEDIKILCSLYDNLKNYFSL